MKLHACTYNYFFHYVVNLHLLFLNYSEVHSIQYFNTGTGASLAL